MKDGLPNILREYRVKSIPSEDAAAPAAYPDNLGFRTKFGGRPDAIQSGSEEPKMYDQCFQPLHFICQIDSFESSFPDVQFMFGDVG